jgi:DNA/RNA-binding domain of Phe-tRNA-synthetase-like protein
MKDFTFSATDEVIKLGVKIVTARMVGVKNSLENKEFEVYKENVLSELKNKLSGKKYDDDLVLAGFRDLHTKVGRSNRTYVASPEGLRYVFLERDRFPHINTVVDIYNLISLKTGLALGAHNVDKIKGNITLKLTTGDEKFIPLGKIEPTLILPGEYGYVDDDNNVVCRLEVLQVETTKITTDSNNLFLIIEGNTNTSDEFVRSTAKEVCEMITKYCGGSFKFLN